jgi:hypothetical protein
MIDHQESDRDFSIDRFQLELEAERMSDLIMHYGKQAARWGAIEKEEKRKLEVTHAACATFIREDPKGYGLKKDTDAIVLKLAMEEPDYLAQHKVWLEAFEMKETYEAAMRALLQKGSMIKELVKLWLNDYYSNTTVSRKEIRPQKPGQESLLNKLRGFRTANPNDED